MHLLTQNENMVLNKHWSEKYKAFQTDISYFYLEFNNSNSYPFSVSNKTKNSDFSVAFHTEVQNLIQVLVKNSLYIKAAQLMLAFISITSLFPSLCLFLEGGNRMRQQHKIFLYYFIIFPPIHHKRY